MSGGRAGVAAAGLNLWELCDQDLHFDLGRVINCAITDIIEPADVGSLAMHHAGLWECNLADDSLIWSGGVYDLFGLRRGTAISRGEVLSFYAEESRTLLERIRADAIKRRLGFTVDVKITAATGGERRSMRIVAAPVCEAGKAVRLVGLKLAV